MGIKIYREYSSPLTSKLSKRIRVIEHRLGLENITGNNVVSGLGLDVKMDLEFYNVVDNVNITNVISKTTAIDRWIDVGEKKDDKSVKYNTIFNIVKPCNNYNYNYNTLQPLSIPTPFFPVSPSNFPSLSAASSFSCKESTSHGNKEKDVRRIKLKESL